MKIKASILVILMLSGIFSFGQETPRPSYSRDLGFNTAFIFEGILNSGEMPFTLMYKKYVSENKANRFGIDFAMSIDNVAGSGGANYSENSHATVRLNIGREVQKEINSKWIWFYGGDIIPFYSFSDNVNFQDGLRYFNNQTSSLGIILRPFLAIRYNINPRIYLSAEASINFSYSRNEQLIEYPQSNSVTRDSKANHISVYARPANGLFLFYRF